MCIYIIYIWWENKRKKRKENEREKEKERWQYFCQMQTKILPEVNILV